MERTAYCEAVAAVSGRALLVPWGRVETGEHVFEVNEEAGRNVLAAFNRQGVDLLVDYEHVSEPQFARADKLAPAMGWVKQIEAVPGEGLFGVIEWTPEGQRLVQNKSYRYLSPVVNYRESDGVVTRLRSAALVNQPAIPRMPALVNKERSNEQEKQMEPLLVYLREKTGLPADASAETILAKCKAADTVTAANKALTAALAPVAGELGEAGRPLAEALQKGEVEAIATGLRTAFNRASNDPAKVDRSHVDALKTEVEALRKERADEKCNALIAANSSKLIPEKRAWFKEFYARDPEYAAKWIAEAPELVRTSPIPAPAPGGGAADRMTAINSARAKFAEGAGWGGRTEREFVDGLLQAENRARLTKDEAEKIGL